YNTLKIISSLLMFSIYHSSFILHDRSCDLIFRTVNHFRCYFTSYDTRCWLTWQTSSFKAHESPFRDKKVTILLRLLKLIPFLNWDLCALKLDRKSTRLNS